MIRVAERARRAGAVALAMAVALAVAPAARAQSSSASARADALFVQGKAALEAGDFAHACPVLQESYAIDPANGTLLALGVCHEGLGRTATAWRELRTAAEGATRDGRADRAQFAQAHVAKLEARLSRLTVVVAGDAPLGLGIDLDETPLPAGEWGKASPVDPGRHTLAAHAPGRKAWTGVVDVAPEHDAQTVTIGPLPSDVPAASPVIGTVPPSVLAASPAGAPAADSVQAPETSTPGAWKRPAAWIAGGVGVVALGVGAFFGVSAITKSNDAKSHCSVSSCTSAGAVSENNDAKTAATVSDIALGAGVVAVGVGAFLFFTAPSPSAPTASTHVAPFLGRQQAGVAFEQTF